MLKNVIKNIYIIFIIYYITNKNKIITIPRK